jgi:hypothetical protein
VAYEQYENSFSYEKCDGDAEDVINIETCCKSPNKKPDFCFALKIQIILVTVYSKINKDLDESVYRLNNSG